MEIREEKMKYKENELYREIEIFLDDTKVGEAEIDLKNKMLSRLTIYEPYQNRQIGTQVVADLTKEYSLTNLWVRADNERAIHVYEKCGYKIIKPTMYLMERSENHERKKPEAQTSGSFYSVCRKDALEAQGKNMIDILYHQIEKKQEKKDRSRSPDL